MEIISEVLILIKTIFLSIALYSSCLYTEKIRRRLIRKHLKRNIIHIERLRRENGRIEEVINKEIWFDGKGYLKFLVILTSIITLIILSAFSLGVHEELWKLVIIHLLIMGLMIVKRVRKQISINERGLITREAFNCISER